MHLSLGGTLRYYYDNPDYPSSTGSTFSPPRKDFTEDLLIFYCRKNADRTMHLALAGNYLEDQIDRRLEPEDFPIIAKFLQKYKQVISVELSYNRIKTDDLVELLLALQSSNVEYLSLMNCDLGMTHVHCIADGLSQTKIKSLRLNNNRFGQKLKGSNVLEQIIENSCLRFLDVGSINADWGLLGSIANAIREPNCCLEVLDVSRILPDDIYSVEHSEFVAEMLEIIIDQGNCLKELHARHNSLTGHDIEYIARGVKRSKTLLFLDLAGNPIGDLGAEYLADALRTRPMLTGLNLCACDIGDIGARALGHAIPLSKLRLLDVSHNRMCYGGLRILFHTIKKPQKLRVLSIWGNRFDNETNKIVHRMLRSGVLERDYVDVWPICEDGIYRMTEAPNTAHTHRQRYYLVRCPPVKPMPPVPNIPKVKLKIDFEHAKKIKASESEEPLPKKIERVSENVIEFKHPRPFQTSVQLPQRSITSNIFTTEEDEEFLEGQPILTCLCREKFEELSSSSSSTSTDTADPSLQYLDDDSDEGSILECKCGPIHDHTCKMLKKKEVHILVPPNNENPSVRKVSYLT